MSTETLATSNVPQLRERIDHLYVSTRAVLDAVPADRYDEKLPSGMTLREVLAHLAAWEETVPTRVESALAGHGDLVGFDDIDGFNAKVSAETRDTSIDDLKARLARSHAAIAELVRSFEGRDVPKLAVDIVEWNTTGHYPDHFGDLGAAMKTAKDVAMAVNAGWINFRLALMSLGESGLDAKTSVGWTFKQMAAHCTGWEDLTVSRLRTLRETGKPASSGVDTDEFNARMAAESDSKTAREVLKDLADAHTRLVKEIEQLTPEQIHANDDWAIAVVAGNSYGHYGEHHTELFAAEPVRERLVEDLEPAREVREHRLRGPARRGGVVHAPEPHARDGAAERTPALAHLLEKLRGTLRDRGEQLGVVLAVMAVRVPGDDSDRPVVVRVDLLGGELLDLGHERGVGIVKPLQHVAGAHVVRLFGQACVELIGIHARRRGLAGLA